MAAVALLAFVVIGRGANLPATAPGSPIAHTNLSSESPVGTECLPRIERQGGWMDACWQAYRYTADADPNKDYYVLYLYGTFSGTSGGGLRWAILKADLDGDPKDNVFDAWPTSAYGGPCQTEPVSLIFVDVPGGATICGRTEGSRDATGWSSTVTWTCEWCLFPDGDARALALYQVVGVQQGTVPAWRIYGNVGS